LHFSDFFKYSATSAILQIYLINFFVFPGELLESFPLLLKGLQRRTIITYK